jgi:hypothetical protein
MKLSTINWELCGAITAMCVCIYLLFTMPWPRKVIYNCSIAEISPDYPTEVKEGCRKLQIEK